MTDKYESAAAKLLGDISVRMLSMSLDAMAYGATNDDKHTDGLLALVATALRSARAEAFEEAAAMVERLVVPFPSRELDSIARRIRSLGLDKDPR